MSSARRAVGIHVLADTLGVSIAIVDRALRDRPIVLTKACVLKAAHISVTDPISQARFLSLNVPLRIAAVIPVEIA